jgi:hypothetical protein
MGVSPTTTSEGGRAVTLTVNLAYRGTGESQWPGEEFTQPYLEGAHHARYPGISCSSSRYPGVGYVQLFSGAEKQTTWCFGVAPNDLATVNLYVPNSGPPINNQLAEFKLRG